LEWEKVVGKKSWEIEVSLLPTTVDTEEEGLEQLHGCMSSYNIQRVKYSKKNWGHPVSQIYLLLTSFGDLW
jgi:hypothetical protein